MQSILSIDFSAQPCELSLCTVEGTSVTVVGSASADIPLTVALQQLAKVDISESIEAALDATREEASNDDGEETSDSGLDSAGETPLLDETRRSLRNLRAAIDSLSGEWTAVSVIIPPHDHLALNLNLPFGDAKNLDRIVDLEVQDVVPFELDDFLVQYSSLGPMTQGGAALDVKERAAPSYDVHVGLMPRAFVRNILNLCKGVGIEPNVLTVPSSVLGSVYHIGRDLFPTNSAVIFNRGDEFSMAVFIDGEVRVERVLHASRLMSANPDAEKDNPLKSVFTALKLMLAAAERRYDTRVENIYILGREVKGSSLQQVFGRPIQGIQIKDFVRSSDGTARLSSLGAAFAADNTTMAPLSNFRTREFSFTPKISEFLKALAGTTRYLMLALGAAAIGILATYVVRAYTIASVRSSLQTRIAKVIPGFTASEDMIGPTLLREESKLSEELGVLASPAKVSPLDALLEILRLLPPGDTVTITSIKISGAKAVITGTAPQLTAIENIGKALRGNNGVFSKVTATPGSSATGKFNFNVELILSQ